MVLDDVVVPSCFATLYVGETWAQFSLTLPWLLAGRTSVHFKARHWKYFIYFLNDCVAMEIHEVNPRSSVEAGGLFSDMELRFRFD